MLIQIMALCFALALTALLCWGSYFVGRKKELGSMLVQTVAVYLVQVLTSLLYCGRYLVEMMRKHISLSLPGIYYSGAS